MQENESGCFFLNTMYIEAKAEGSVCYRFWAIEYWRISWPWNLR